MTAPAFKLLEIAAAGTFGTVCIAQDLHTGTLVALKVLKRAHMHRPRVIARTRDEAAMLARITHPGIVHVEGLVHIQERPVVVMEWVRGMSLEHLVRAFPDGLPVGIAVELTRQATVALGAAYASQSPETGEPMRIIHRDVKPSNMILSVDGELKVVDFGIARGQFEGKESKTLSMVLGARGYLAPERLDGHEDKVSIDIYSLGICLYELAMGKHVVLSVHEAFHAEALDKAMSKLTPEGLSAEATQALGAIIAGACRYHEADRPTHDQLAQQLQDFLDTYQLDTDVARFARHKVVPLFHQRKRIRPIDHPGYPDLAFLDRTAANCPRPAEPDVNAQIGELLQTEDWHLDSDPLDLLLVKNPHWTEAPFVEALPDQLRPWWKFWGRDKAMSPEQLVKLFRYIKRRPITGEIRRRLLPLKAHPDPTVQQAVGALLNGE